MGQNNINGFIEDANTGERLIGVNIVDTISGMATSSNAYGYFSLASNNRQSCIVASYVGQLSAYHTLTLNSDTTLIIKIETNQSLDEIVVQSNDYRQGVSSPIGSIKISVEQMKQMPTLGEVDVLKVLQYQPGVKGGMEGSSGMNVRGGSHGENMFLLDDVPVYNVSHMYGFFSAFNSSAIKDIQLYKSGFSANYGGRVSSIVDIKSREGNNSGFGGEASIGFVSSKLMFEGPLFNKSTTFILSARSSYINMVMKPLKHYGLASESFPEYNFHDFNFGLTHTFSNHDRLYFNAYYGRDKMFYQDNYVCEEENVSLSESLLNDSGWGNVVGSIRWNHTFSRKLFSNLTVASSRYQYGAEKSNQTHSLFIRDNETIEVAKDYFSSFNSYILDYSGKIDFDYYYNEKLKIKSGLGTTLHTFQLTDKQIRFSDSQNDNPMDTAFYEDPVQVVESFAYLQSRYQINSWFTLNAGLRLSGQGYQGGHSIGVEPRVSADYKLTPNLIVKAGASRMIQYMSLISLNNTGMNLDIWVPNINENSPLTSDEISCGLSYQPMPMWFFSVESYFKRMENISAFESGMSVFDEKSDLLDRLTQGNGESTGLEFMLQKQQGVVTGSMAYTLSRSMQQFDELNHGNPFPFKYDRLHDFTIITTWQITEKIDISALWVFGSGYPVSLPIAKYETSESLFSMSTDLGGYLFYYPGLNNARLPVYHRLDVGIHYAFKNRVGLHKLSVDVFNAYNRNNPIGASYNWNGQLTYDYLLPIIPSISYTLKF